MSWVVDKSTQHTTEKPDCETASSGILTGELTHVSRRRNTVGLFYTALLSASSTSAHSRGGGKKEEEEISAIKGSPAASRFCTILTFNHRVMRCG